MVNVIVSTNVNSERAHVIWVVGLVMLALAIWFTCATTAYLHMKWLIPFLSMHTYITPIVYVN